MTTNDQEPRSVLEDNVRRLFGRLEKTSPTSSATRDRILEKLLQNGAPAPSSRLARRWVRWAGLAAALFVAAGILAVNLDDPDASHGRTNAEKRSAAATTKPSGDVTLVGFAIHLLAGGPGGSVVQASSAVDGEPVHLQPERYVSNSDVESARVKQAASGCQVEVRLTDEGTEKLARLTRNHIGEKLALLIDGKVVMTPTIRSEITGGLVLLTGAFLDTGCEEIARGLAPSR